MAVLGGDYTKEALGNLWYLSSDPNLATFVGGALASLPHSRDTVLIMPCRTCADVQRWRSHDHP